MSQEEKTKELLKTINNSQNNNKVEKELLNPHLGQILKIFYGKIAEKQAKENEKKFIYYDIGILIIAYLFILKQVRDKNLLENYFETNVTKTELEITTGGIPGNRLDSWWNKFLEFSEHGISLLFGAGILYCWKNRQYIWDSIKSYSKYQ